MCNNLDEHENAIGRILDHKDNKGSDPQTLHALTKKVSRMDAKQLARQLALHNKRTYA